MMVLCFSVTNASIGFFVKCENVNGYCAKRVAQWRRLTEPYNVMEWLYLVCFDCRLIFPRCMISDSLPADM